MDSFRTALHAASQAPGEPKSRRCASSSIDERLIAVERTCELLAQAGNDYSRSSWLDAEAALAEMRRVLAELRAGGIPEVLGTLFAPTGPIQEVAAASGWGSEFLDLARVVDEEICPCLGLTQIRLEPVADLGMDDRFGEASLSRCNRCGRLWLRYLHEMEAFSRSGRWFEGVLDPQTAKTVSADNARAVLESLPWYRRGGSFHDGEIRRASGPISL